jgi:hypothetical protein
VTDRSCPQLVDTGAYVLGALSPPQRIAFERHMVTCADCQAEVNDLAVLPGLLGRIDADAASGLGELPAPTVLPGVLAKVHKQRRGRRVLAFAAGLAVACLALVAGLNMPSLATNSATKPIAAPSPIGSPAATITQPVMIPMQSIDESEPVTAQVALTEVAGGTKILMTCQYPAATGAAWDPEHGFKLFVVPRDGSPAQQVDAWAAHPGQAVTATGMTAWSLAQIDRLELRTASGDELLVYNNPG